MSPPYVPVGCATLAHRLAIPHTAAMPRNLLFICTQNRLRSPTAEQVFAEWPGVETASAGLGNDVSSPTR